VLELTDMGYVIVGDRADVRAADNEATTLALLPDDAPGRTWEEVRELWPHDPPIGKTTLMGVLNFGVTHGKWKRAGMGVRGDPFRYRRLTPDENSIRPAICLGTETNRIEPQPPESSAQGLAPERTAWHTDATEGGSDQWPV
jgi:hypothetical protein